MNVCFVAQHSVTMVAGGPSVQALETARYLADMGIDVAFFNPWERYSREQFDLYHVFGANMMTHDIALRLRQFGHRFAVSSIVYSRRSPWMMRATRRAESLVNRVVGGVWTDYGLTARVCSYADMVMPNTADEGRLLVEGLGVERRRVRVIPNGVHERFADASPELFRSTYGLDDFILTVGHIGSRRKNLLALLRALATIDHPAVVIGQVQHGSYAEQCLAEARRNRNVTIIDGLPNDSPLLASAYAAARVFALPSEFETPGIAALEAGLAGAAVVITPHGGTREYFGAHAYYPDPGSVSSIADAIRQALAAPRTDALRNHIGAEFLWRRVAERTAEAYRELLNTGEAV